MTIYKRIKELRETLGMSQQELAEKVGYKTASAVNKIELGLRDINQSKILAFSKALNTTPSFLMGCDEEKAPETEAPKADERFEKIWAMYSALSDSEKDAADKYLAFLLESQKND